MLIRLRSLFSVIICTPLEIRQSLAKAAVDNRNRVTDLQSQARPTLSGPYHFSFNTFQIVTLATLYSLANTAWV